VRPGLSVAAARERLASLAGAAYEDDKAFLQWMHDRSATSACLS
jgi:hypothetical protein